MTAQLKTTVLFLTLMLTAGGTAGWLAGSCKPRTPGEEARATQEPLG